jgi:hypothetical protein
MFFFHKYSLFHGLFRSLSISREALVEWLGDEERAMLLLDAGCASFAARAECHAGLWKLSGDVMNGHVRNFELALYR